MIKDGLKNETFTSELLSKGSSAITSRNDFGVHIFSGSLSDGVVSGKLSRPKYNIDELQKTINTTITELLPVNRPEIPATVPQSVYDAAIADITNRDTIIEQLNTTTSELQSRISEIEAENERLDIEIDGARTLQSISENQTQIANLRVSSTIEQLQFSIQKATQEAIQRASLEARNQVLLTENASLREQLFGKTSQLQAGAKSSGTLFTVNPQPQTKTGEPPIRGSQRFRAIGDTVLENKDITFVNGENITIFNSSSDTITITITKSGSTDWFGITPLEFTLPSNGTRVMALTKGRKNWNNSGKTKNYDGRLVFTGRSSEGGSESVTLVTRIRRYE